ncbi:MAG TPA: LysR family transcriptional regulator [Lachnospiraceae bacterium]|nr:LysR family transcriptional regulator [Lachnospiraceae bacterium]
MLYIITALSNHKILKHGGYNMEFKSYEYVQAIKEERSFSKAAKKLFISQPSLSQYISRLEEQVGVTLFDRSTSPVNLTYEGELYLEAMAQIMEIQKSMQKKFDDISDMKIGRLNIGLTPSKADTVLPMVLPEFRKQYPNIELTLTEAPSSRLETMLERGEVDICLMNLPIKSRNIEYEEITKENILLCVPPNFPENLVHDGKNGKYVKISELVDQPFVFLHPDQRIRQIGDALFQADEVKPKVAIETGSIQTSLLLTDAGLGCSFVPETTLKYVNLSNEPKCYKIDENGLDWTLVIAYKEGSYRTKAVQAFTQTLKSIIEK